MVHRSGMALAKLAGAAILAGCPSPSASEITISIPTPPNPSSSAMASAQPVMPVELTEAPKPRKKQQVAEVPNPKSCCKGLNECKGRGNCKTDKHNCKSMNDCKGRGGCRGGDCE